MQNSRVVIDLKILFFYGSINFLGKLDNQAYISYIRPEDIEVYEREKSCLKLNKKKRYDISHLNYSTNDIVHLKIVFLNKPGRADHLFYKCDKIIEINLSDFNTEEMVAFSYMFFECAWLRRVNFGKKNKFTKATHFNYRIVFPEIVIPYDIKQVFFD